MSRFTSGLAGAFVGASSGLEFLIKLLESREADAESKRRFEEQMGLEREQFGYRKAQDAAAQQERSRERVRMDRTRRQEMLLDLINRRGGSYLGAPEDLTAEVPMPASAPGEIAGVIGRAAPGAQYGLEAALEAARGARQSRQQEMVNAITAARQRAQSTQRAQTAEGFPIVVDPQEVFNPNTGMANYASIGLRTNQYQMQALDRVYKNTLGALKGGAAGALLKDIFTNPARKGEIEAMLMQQAKAIYVSQLQQMAQLDPSFAQLAQDPGWVEGQIPAIVQQAITEATLEQGRGPVSPPSGGSTGTGFSVEPPPADAPETPTGPSKDAQRLLDIRRRMAR